MASAGSTNMEYKNKKYYNLTYPQKEYAIYTK